MMGNFMGYLLSKLGTRDDSGPRDPKPQPEHARLFSGTKFSGNRSATYFMSMLTRMGAPSVTDTACRFSPSCGCLNTISCGPIATLRLPMGVSPTR